VGSGKWRNIDERLPKAVESEEKFDGFGTGDGFHSAESAVAARALEGMDGPDGLDEVAPERAQGAGGGCFGWRDEEDLDGRRGGFFAWWFFGWWRWDDDRVCGAGQTVGASGRPGRRRRI